MFLNILSQKLCFSSSTLINITPARMGTSPTRTGYITVASFICISAIWHFFCLLKHLRPCPVSKPLNSHSAFSFWRIIDRCYSTIAEKWGNTLAGTSLHFSDLFTCGVGGSLTSSKTAFLYQLSSYWALPFISISLWSKGSFLQLQLTPGLSSLPLSWTRCCHLQLCTMEGGYGVVTSVGSSFVCCFKGLWEVEGNGKTVVCSLKGQQNTLNSEHANQLSCPKTKKRGLMHLPDPSKFLQSGGFAHKPTLNFWINRK